MKLFIETGNSAFNGFSVQFKSDLRLIRHIFIWLLAIVFHSLLSTSMTAMARLEAQECIEYYQWLFRIEREQFEK